MLPTGASGGGVPTPPTGGGVGGDGAPLTTVIVNYIPDAVRLLPRFGSVGGGWCHLSRWQRVGAHHVLAYRMLCVAGA